MRVRAGRSTGRMACSGSGHLPTQDQQLVAKNGNLYVFDVR
jgi:hypothetical protein